MKSATGRDAEAMFKGEALALQAMYGQTPRPPRVSLRAPPPSPPPPWRSSESPAEWRPSHARDVPVPPPAADTNTLKIPKVFHYGAFGGGVPGGGSPVRHVGVRRGRGPAGRTQGCGVRRGGSGFGEDAGGRASPTCPLPPCMSRCIYAGHLTSGCATAPGGGLRGSGSFIVMEYLEFSGRASGADLGRQLALMHKTTPADPVAASGKFGFPVDNTCGATPQPNAWKDDWVEFYREQRLRHQLKLTGNREMMMLGDKLCDSLDTFFEGIEVRKASGCSAIPLATRHARRGPFALSTLLPLPSRKARLRPRGHPFRMSSWRHQTFPTP